MLRPWASHTTIMNHNDIVRDVGQRPIRSVAANLIGSSQMQQPGSTWRRLHALVQPAVFCCLYWALDKA